MSGCGLADRTARWATSEPPRWTIRRTAAILAVSILLLVVAGVPAWATASIAPAEVEADTDAALAVTVTEPGEDNEEYGDTARVRVGAPSGFTVLACGNTPVGWNCTVAEDGTAVTFVRDAPVALVDSRDFGFSVHTPAINGTYAFRVTQADGPPNEEDPPATVSSRPAVTVTGGQDPPPSPKPTPPADDGGSQDGGASQTDTGGTQGGGGTSTDPQPEQTTQADGAQDGGDTDSDAGSSDTSTNGSSGGSTAPQRTQGRASGTTLEVIPGEETDDQPGVVAPDVADDPAIARPDAADDDSTAVAATGAEASADPRGGTPWQQWVGAAMLLAGGAVVANRRWDLAGRLRELEPLGLLRRWRGR